MGVRRGTKTAAKIRMQTVAAVEVIDGERRVLPVEEAWRRFDATRAMRIVQLDQMYALWMGTTKPMIELRVKTNWRAVCTTCTVALSSDIPIDECHNCDSTSLVREDDALFEMWWHQAHQPPPNIPVGHQRRTAIDFVRAERQGQHNEMAAVGRSIGERLGEFVAEAALRMTAKHPEGGEHVLKTYTEALLKFFNEYLPNTDPALYNRMVGAILGATLD